MKPISLNQRSDQGMALVFALGILVVLIALTTTSVVYFGLQMKEVGYERLGMEARCGADAGIRAGTINVIEAVQAGQEPQSVLDLTLPVYIANDKEPGALVSNPRKTVRVAVTIEDENSKVNLNHASVRLLQALFGIDGITARAIRAYAHETGFNEPHDLVSQSLLTEEQLAKVDPADLTCQVTDVDNATAVINVNTASPEVLAAVCDVPIAVANRMVEARPFVTVDDLVAAAGKTLDTFNVSVSADAPDAMPSELAFTSKAFRIVSRGELCDVKRAEDLPKDADAASRYTPLRTSEATAIVVVNAKNQPVFTYRSDGEGTVEQPAEVSEPAA